MKRHAQLISEILREGTATGQNLTQYDRATDRISMLFGDDVVAYSSATRKRIIQLSYHETMIKAQGNGQEIPGYHLHVDKAHDILLEISKFYEEFSALVVPYVRLTHKLSTFG